MADDYFTEEQKKSILHLKSLVMRQIQMGVPETAAAAVLAGCAGQVAAATGWSREAMLSQLPEAMGSGFDGFKEGVKQSGGKGR